jgi:hypothetical protein
MSTTQTVTPSDTITERGESIIVDRVLPSGRTERWVFAGYDMMGNVSGLRVAEGRPHHFPKHLWEEIQYMRETWPERHPKEEDATFRWVRNQSGHWTVWGSDVCPYYSH